MFVTSAKVFSLMLRASLTYLLLHSWTWPKRQRRELSLPFLNVLSKIASFTIALIKDLVQTLEMTETRMRELAGQRL